MPDIQNITLEIAENQGAAAILVTYSLVNSLFDSPEPRSFVETVELVGADERVGEKGDDKVLPGVGFQGSLTAPIGGILRRTRLMAMQARELNEDNGGGLIDLQHDEIFARVTISRNMRIFATGSSEIVRRGGLLWRPPYRLPLPSG